MIGLEIPFAIILTFAQPQSQADELTALKEQAIELRTELKEQERWQYRFGVDEVKDGAA